MEDTTPTQPSLGEIGYIAACHALGIEPGQRQPEFVDLREKDQGAWSAAAAAIVMEYDRRLYQEAEDKAVNMGLDPQPLPGITPPADA